MQSSEKHLVLRLSAPMMSFRTGVRKEILSTHEMPTKSAVVGMIQSAFKGSRGDTALTKEIASLRMASYRLSKNPSILCDLQTVGGGEGRRMPGVASGGWKKIITSRYYLTSEYFLVILSGDGDLVDRCLAAIRRPGYVLFFGTKCCLPSERIDVGVFDSFGEAEAAVKKDAVARKIKFCHVVRDAGIDEFPDDYLIDHPLRFGLDLGGHRRRPVVCGIESFS